MKLLTGFCLIMLASPTYATESYPADNCQGAKQEETILAIGSCEHGGCYVKTTPHNTKNFNKEVNLNIVPKQKAFVGEKHTFTSVYCINKELEAEARTPASI